MYRSAYDLKSFYNTLSGRIVRRILREHILEFWPEIKGLRLMGCGYTIPYLKPYIEEAERVFAVMPAAQGAHHWPPPDKNGGGNLVCLAEESELPIESNSIDRILLVHSLEFSEMLRPTFEELFRVLKSNGRLLMIVPNRLGFWARADWTPFGQGAPYTASQVEYFLRDNLFVHESTRKALFVPAFRKNFFLRSAAFFEQVGRYVYPAMGGVHMVEASKQIYAGTGEGIRSNVTVRGRSLAPSNPLPVRRSSTTI